MTLRRGSCSAAAAGLVWGIAAAQASAPPPIVTVYVAGSPEAVAGSRDAVQELCAHSNVAVVVRDAAGADEALLATSHASGLAEAYVDLRPGTPPRVVVVDGETRQDLERRSLPEGVSLEMSIETMAHVVCAAVESSLSARAASVPAPPAAPPLPAPARAVPDPAVRPAPERTLRPPFQGEASLFASTTNFGGGFRAGAGAALAVNRRLPALRPGAILSFSGYPSADVTGAGGQASLGSVALRLLGSVEWNLSPRAQAFVALGGGGDWTRISGENPPPGTVARGVGSAIDPILSALLGVRLQLGGGVSLLAAVDADLNLSRHHYVIRTPAGSQPFFDPARVRPVALVGLSISLGAAPPHSLTEARR